jgi:PPOX class probable F420-dependent enzyme
VARLGVLADDGTPRVFAITYALAGSTLFSAVDDHKRKRLQGERLARVRWLRARPRAALTVDRYDDDWSQLAWVQALGAVRIIDAASAPEAIAALAERYAPYRDRHPAGPVLALEPDRVLWWRA